MGAFGEELPDEVRRLVDQAKLFVPLAFRCFVIHHAAHRAAEYLFDDALYDSVAVPLQGLIPGLFAKDAARHPFTPGVAAVT